MIRIRYKQHLDDKAFKERRRITLDEVAKETDISKATLTRIANVPGYNVGTEAIDKLCKYFGVTPCELLEYIDEN